MNMGGYGGVKALFLFKFIQEAGFNISKKAHSCIYFKCIYLLNDILSNNLSYSFLLCSGSVI